MLLNPEIVSNIIYLWLVYWLGNYVMLLPNSDISHELKEFYLYISV